MHLPQTIQRHLNGNQVSKEQIQVIGYASCVGAQDQRCDSGPVTLKDLDLTTRLETANYQVSWSPIITPDRKPESASDTLSIITDNCKVLARQTHEAISSNKKIIVIGGDHSCAIGTWSGVYSALPNPSQLGLIWIDAHMDSHTIKSSSSGAIHGMPVAALLGHGDSGLCQIESANNKILPQNLCLVGVRSFEPAEESLLQKLGVKVFYMEQIKKLGLDKVMLLAREHVSKNGNHVGVSLDLDAIDPEDAPGVGSPENQGISGKSLIETLENIDFGENFIGIEITELNSHRDYADKTARLAIEAILASFSRPE